MIIRFNPSGTHVKRILKTGDNVLKVRLDIFPEVGDKTYDQHYIYKPVFPEGGYPGKVDAEGNPTNQVAYDKWIAFLPHIWELNPCLCHFIQVSETVIKADVAGFIEQILKQADITALDDALILPNSAHLVSPLMRTKAALSTAKVLTTDHEDLILSTNARLADLILTKNGGGAGIEVLPESIDVGPGATVRATNDLNLGTMTSLDTNNPANAGGTLDTFELYFASGTPTVDMGTIYGSGTSYTTRDYESLGSVSSGSKQTFTGLTCDVTTGDFLGIYYDDASLYIDIGTGTTFYYYAGNHFTTGGTQTYEAVAPASVSIYATGTEGGGTTYEGLATSGLIFSTLARTNNSLLARAINPITFNDLSRTNKSLIANAIDSLKLYDLSRIGLSFTDTITEALRLNDLSRIALTYYSSVTDSLRLNDLSRVFTTLPLSITDRVGLTDLSRTITSYIANAVDSLRLNDLSRVSNSLISNAVDSLRLNDLSRTTVEWSAAVIDAVRLNDLSRSTASFIANAIDAIGLNDLSLTVVSFVSGVLDKVGLSDLSRTKMDASPNVLDNMALSDTPSSTISFEVAVKDQLAGTDGSLTQLTISLIQSSSLAFTDYDLLAAIAGTIYEALATSTLALSDLSSVFTSMNPVATDNLKTSDGSATIAEFDVRVLDSSRLNDFVRGFTEIQSAAADSVGFYEGELTSTKYESYETGGAYYTSVYGVNETGQTFLPQVSHTLTSLRLKLFRLGLPGMATVSIRTAAFDGIAYNADPNEVDLCSATFNSNDLDTSEVGAWVDIPFTDGGCSVLADTPYAIILRVPSGDTNNRVRWRIDITDLYIRGNYVSTNTGWGIPPNHYATTWDLLFQEWGTILTYSPSTQLTASPIVPDTLALTDDDSITFEINLTLSDSVNLNDAARAIAEFFSTVLEDLTITDVARGTGANRTVTFTMRINRRSLTAMINDRNLTTLMQGRTLTTQINGRTLTMKVNNRTITITF